MPSISLVAIAVVPPDEIVARDPQRREDAVEHQLVDVLLVGQRDAFGQPVRAAVAVRPFRARLEDQLRVAARFLEAGRLRRQVQDRDLVDPAGFGIALRRRAERRMMLRDLVGQRDLAVENRQPQRRRAERFRGRLQIVPLLQIAPRHHELAAARDVARSAAGQRVVASFVQLGGIESGLGRRDRGPSLARKLLGGKQAGKYTRQKHRE